MLPQEGQPEIDEVGEIVVHEDDEDMDDVDAEYQAAFAHVVWREIARLHVHFLFR